MDGEIYAIRVALGLLSYFENELMMSTFNEAISILLYPQKVNDELLIDSIESVEVIILIALLF